MTRARLALALILSLLTGCKGLDRLLGHKIPTRDSNYDTAPIPTAPPHSEPYAILQGYMATGERLYIVHWTDTIFDGEGMPESEVDKYGFPKFQS